MCYNRTCVIKNLETKANLCKRPKKTLCFRRISVIANIEIKEKLFTSVVGGFPLLTGPFEWDITVDCIGYSIES